MAKKARDTALANAASTEEWHAEAEAKLKVLQEVQAAYTHRLQKWEEDLKAREAKLANRDSELTQVTLDQAAERDRLAKLKDEVAEAQVSHAQCVSEATAQLDTRERTLMAADKKAVAQRDALPSLELRSR